MAIKSNVEIVSSCGCKENTQKFVAVSKQLRWQFVSIKGKSGKMSLSFLVAINLLHFENIKKMQ